ncbi:hypothetical protein KNSL1_013361 [Colletotrichum chrysophilum]|nr:hypothetical protein KNSL1_013361 [Colletotrichum chrysophilum]
MIKSNIIYASISLFSIFLQQTSACRQAIVTYSTEYECDLDHFDTAIAEDCKKLAEGIGKQGKKFAEPPVVDSVECLECDPDGESRKCRCLLSAWRFRDWEPEPAKFDDFQYEYWRPMENGKLDVIAVGPFLRLVLSRPNKAVGGAERYPENPGRSDDGKIEGLCA